MCEHLVSPCLRAARPSGPLNRAVWPFCVLWRCCSAAHLRTAGPTASPCHLANPRGTGDWPDSKAAEDCRTPRRFAIAAAAGRVRGVRLGRAIAAETRRVTEPDKQRESGQQDGWLVARVTRSTTMGTMKSDSSACLTCLHAATPRQAVEPRRGGGRKPLHRRHPIRLRGLHHQSKMIRRQAGREPANRSWRAPRPASSETAGDPRHCGKSPCGGCPRFIT